jgi:hypothetical protein
MKSDLIKNSLLSIGLDEFSTLVYLELLQNDKHDISSLSVKLNTYRLKIYQSLDKLTDFGLIKNINKDYSRQIILETPRRINSLIKEKQSSLGLISKKLDDYLPQLQSEFYSTRKQPLTSIYQGVTQFKLFFDLILDETEVGGEILVIGDGPDFEDIVTAEYFLQNWMRRRLEKKIRVRILARHLNQRLKSIMKNNDLELRQTKFMDKQFTEPGCLWITKNKVINWNTVLPKAIVIEDQIMAQFYTGLFESIWNLY